MFLERSVANAGNIYLLGMLRQGAGFPGYYLVAFLLKVPLAIQILLVIALWDWLRKFRWEEFIHREMYFLLPALIFTIYFNFFYRSQIGIRYLLVIFPVLLIFSTRIFRHGLLFSRRTRLALGGLGIFLALSVFSYFPNYLSYFNELILNRSNAYRYLADLNLDWGQNEENLKGFLAQHPDYHYNPDGPTSGRLVVEANHLVGILELPDYRWLRENFDPVGNYRYSYLIYDIAPADLTRLQLK